MTGWVRNDMKRAQDGLRVHVPRRLRAELDKASGRLGRRGVRIARTLVAVRTGRTRGAITYATDTRRGRGGGFVYLLRVYVDAATKAAALATFVTEFGRGHGKTGARARGKLVPRPFLRPSRELVARTARGSFRRAMNIAAKAAATGG